MIQPVEEGNRRPRWSVMIPVYNCAQLLRKTLESVLQQAPGIDFMQIEVVDDCSLGDDPEAVVRSIGGGRVDFFRKTRNEGAIANYNTCIQHSRGDLVHILHGDDWVLPGFYSEIERLSGQYPEASLFGTRSFFADEEGFLTGVTRRVTSLESPAKGPVYLDQDASVQCAGMVMRRDFYEKTGGFMENLPHTADVEMWTRAFHVGAGVLSPEVLSVYRVFEGNDTSRLVRNAGNLRDLACLYRMLGERVQGYDYARSRRFLQRFAILQLQASLERQDAAAADAARKFYLEQATPSEKVWFWRWDFRRRLRSWTAGIMGENRESN
jgi:glycosyltransferase involved in cell wall biosynthesis